MAFEEEAVEGRGRRDGGDEGVRDYLDAIRSLETVTGVASLTTGYLSMPPLLGLGTAIDLTVLLAGLGAALVRVSKSGNGSVE